MACCFTGNRRLAAPFRSASPRLPGLLRSRMASVADRAPHSGAGGARAAGAPPAVGISVAAFRGSFTRSGESHGRMSSPAGDASRTALAGRLPSAFRLGLACRYMTVRPASPRRFRPRAYARISPVSRSAHGRCARGWQAPGSLRRRKDLLQPHHRFSWVGSVGCTDIAPPQRGARRGGSPRASKFHAASFSGPVRGAMKGL